MKLEVAAHLFLAQTETDTRQVSHMCKLQFLLMGDTSDKHICISIDFELKPQTKETSVGNIKNKHYNDKFPPTY